MAVAAGQVGANEQTLKEPWSFILFRKSPWRTTITGLVLVSGLLAAVALLEFLSGRPAEVLRGVPAIEVGCEYLLGDYRIGIVGIIVLVYSMCARVKLSQWTHEAVARLNHSAELDADTLAETRWWGFVPGAIGITICLAFAIDIAEREIEWTSAYWILPHIINWGWCVPFGWVGGRLIFSVITDAIIVSRVARSIEVENLEKMEPIDAATRHGLRSALISLMFLGIISVHFVDPGLDLPAIAFLVVLFLIGVMISTLPTFGVLQSYYDKRDDELRLIRDEIEVEEQQLLSKDPGYEPGRIGDLVSMEQRLDGWKVRVFRFSTIARLGLYTALGFVSWLGAAAVSVFVEKLFEL